MADKTHSFHDPLTLTILATLHVQPSHPYEIQRLIREHHNEFAIVPPRSLYHAVDRLQQAGLVEPAETNREGKRPERTIYRITEEGREEFQIRLREMLSTPAKEYPAFMVALSFLSALSSDVVLRALQGRAVHLEGEIAGRSATLRAFSEQPSGEQLPRIVLLELEYMLVLSQAECAWVWSLIEDLRSGKLAWTPAQLQAEWVERAREGE